MTCVVALLYLLQPVVLSTLDLKIYDFLLKSRSGGTAPRNIVIVDIDTKSLSAYGQWPWPRFLIAQLVEKLHDMGALSVGVDILFAEPDRSLLRNIQKNSSGDFSGTLSTSKVPRQYIDNDALLADALRKGPFVIAYQFLFDDKGEKGCLLHPVNVLLRKEPDVPDSVSGLFNPSSVDCIYAPLAEATPASGFLNIQPDHDGIIRRVPLIMEYNDRFYAHLSLAVFLSASKQEHLVLTVGEAGTERLTLDNVTIPLEPKGSFLIPFHGSHGIYRHISASDILSGVAARKDIEGRIVITGAVAPGLVDLHATPTDPTMAGVEVLASIIDAISQREFIVRPQAAVVYEFFAIICFGVLSTIFLARYKTVANLILFFLFTLAAVTLTVSLFRNGIYISPLYTLLAYTSNFSLLSLLDFWHHERLLKEKTRQQIATQEAKLHAEELLRSSEQLYRSLFENMLNGFAYCRMLFSEDQPQDFIYLAVNDAFKTLTGLQDVVGKKVTEVIPSIRESDPELFQICGRVALSGNPVRFETYVNALSMWLSISVYSPQKEHFVALFDVVTERKRSEEALRRTQFAVDTSRDAVFLIKHDAGLAYVNDAACRSLGYTKYELLSLTVFDFDPEFPRDKWYEYWAQNRQLESYMIETVYMTKNGHRFPVEIAINPIRFGEEEYQFYYARDITARKEAERSLQESELKFRTIVQNAQAIIFILDNNGVFLLSEGQALAKIGLDPGQVVGISAFELYKDNSEVLEAVKRSLGGELTRIVNVVKGVVFDVVYSPYFDIAGKRSGVMGIAIDVTERKRAEEEKDALQAQLLRSQKLEAIGALAGGIAHDFNNILQAMMGYLSLFLMKAPGELDVSYVKKAEAIIEHAVSLTRGLLAFGRKQQADMYQFDLNKMVGQFHSLIARVIGEHIILHVRLAPAELNILGNQGLLEQVLMNMAINARDAMPDGGELRVEVDSIDLSEAAALVNGCDRPGSYARISITDTGAGMSYEMTQKIFEPYFTTKEVGKGTGLGLAISFGTIRQHGGNITVYSEEGEGTTFRIYLPLSGDAPAFTQQEELEAVLDGTETVLFVEDFGPLRDTMRIVLEAHGYRVVEAVDGKEALAKFRTSKNKIDIVVTDVIMPNMNGKELADLIRQETPDMRFIFVSGYTPASLKGKWREDLGLVISKPVSPALLTRKIREVLDEVRS